MDRFIAAMPAEEDGDLMLCRDHGIAYQRDMTPTAHYDAAYYAKCAGYEGSDIAEKINAGRVSMVDRYIGTHSVLDIGIGSGEFIRRRPNTYGFDVNPVAIEWLKRNDLFAVPRDDFTAFTFWDVIEHLETPEVYFSCVGLHAFVFTSIPIHASLDVIRESKHYRPGEHLMHFTHEGFLFWMCLHGFMLLDTYHFETEAGRDSIVSFAFKRNRWPRQA